MTQEPGGEHQELPLFDGPLVRERSFWQRMPAPVFALVSLAVVFVLYQVVAGGVVLLFIGTRLTDENAVFIRWATVVSQIACILVPALIFGRLRFGTLRSAFPFRFPGARQTILSVMAVFALQQLLQVYMVVQESIPLPAKIREVIDLVNALYDQTYRMLGTAHTPVEFLIVVFTVALVPAVAEEVLFRGLVQHTVEETSGGLRAALATGLIFGAYHLNPWNIVPLVALGSFFGYLVYRSRNLSIAVSAHFFNNFVACMATFMNVNDDFIALAPAGPVSGPILFANAALFFLVFAGSTYFFVKVTDEASDDAA
jgi:uncharacterized protein